MNYQFFAPASLLYKLLHRLCAVVLIRPFPFYLCLPNTPLSNLDLAVAFDRFAQQLRLSPPRIASRLSPSLPLSFNLSAFASQLPDHLLHRSIQGARACSSRNLYFSVFVVSVGVSSGVSTSFSCAGPLSRSQVCSLEPVIV